MPQEDHALREQLVEFLRGRSAHADLNAAVDKFPAAHYGSKLSGFPHTAWQLLEHIRLTLHDLVAFSIDPEYVAPEWPRDYWPRSEAPATPAEWNISVKAAKADLAELERLAGDPESNLYATIPWGTGQTLLRELLLAGDHTSYHVGQLIMLRQQLGIWKS